jgi:tripartite-type tricarboxylate transporter receptor subunit TctC
MFTRREMLRVSGAGLVSPGVAFVGQAFAQSNTKLIRLIIGFPAGGGGDQIARILAERLRLRQTAPVIVENMPGASGRLSVEFVKNAEADGTVLLVAPEALITVFPHSFRKLNYDPLRELTPLAPIVGTMYTYSIGPAVPPSVHSLLDFMHWCKGNPDPATFATPSAGTPPHFLGLMLASAAGVEMTPVHYRGGAPALQDLLGGHVSASVNPIVDIMPFANSGMLRILAVSGLQRSRFLPDIPTIRESGYSFDVQSWVGIFAPAKVPPDTVLSLNAAIGEAVGSPEMAGQLAKLGGEPMFESPEQFSVRVKEDMERWGPVVKAFGFIAE